MTYAYTESQSNEFCSFFKTKLSESESEDEGVNRAASLLLTCKTIVTTSSWCEPKIICLLFEATKEQKFDQELVAKVRFLNFQLWISFSPLQDSVCADFLSDYFGAAITI